MVCKTFSMTLSLAVLASVAIAWSPVDAHAQTIAAVDRGWYMTGGEHYAAIDSYLCGYSAGDGFEYRNWFLFSIPSPAAGQQYVSATLQLYNPVFFSPTDSEVYAVTDVSASFTDLRADNGNGNGLDIFRDLGKVGVEYGSAGVTSGSRSTLVVPLNAGAVSAINAAAGQPLEVGGNFALGGFVSTIDGVGGNELIFAATASHQGAGSDAVRLVLTTGPVSNVSAPEPGSFVLAGLALPVVLPILVRRRRRH